MFDCGTGETKVLRLDYLCLPSGKQGVSLKELHKLPAVLDFLVGKPAKAGAKWHEGLTQVSKERGKKHEPYTRLSRSLFVAFATRLLDGLESDPNNNPVDEVLVGHILRLLDSRRTSLTKTRYWGWHAS